MSIERHHGKSKQAVAYQLSHLPETAGHIPDTELLLERSLKRMMAKYDKVYTSSPIAEESPKASYGLRG